MSELHKFLFEGLPVRGLLVRLTDSWREVLKRREVGGAFPPEVRQLLGEMAAAGVLMQSNIKFDGAVVLQIFGDGPVKLGVVEVQSDLSFRATAKVVGEVPEGAQLEAMVNVHGQGRCQVTLDPKSRMPGQQPYQGIVSLHGDPKHGPTPPAGDEQAGGAGSAHEPLQKLSQVLEHYMLQSEQLDTQLILAANDEMAAGLLIQRLPVQGEGNLAGGAQNEDDIGLSDAYNRISILAGTLTSEELLGLDADTILRRLFWEETVRRFEPQHPRFACTCSRERVGQMLKGLGREEIDSVIEERGEVETTCEFCGSAYRYDAVDVGELFAAGLSQAGGSSTVQ